MFAYEEQTAIMTKKYGVNNCPYLPDSNSLVKSINPKLLT